MKHLLLLLFGFVTYGQQLHHQMISSQGAAVTLNDGVRIKQTIGQQSVIGNYMINSNIVGQGFHQNNKPKSAVSTISVVTTTYPNPFIDKVTFKFSQQLEGMIAIAITGIAGKLLYFEERFLSDNTLTVENINFPSGVYFIELRGKNYKYATTIIKG